MPLDKMDAWDEITGFVPFLLLTVFVSLFLFFDGVGAAAAPRISEVDMTVDADGGDDNSISMRVLFFFLPFVLVDISWSRDVDFLSAVIDFSG